MTDTPKDNVVNFAARSKSKSKDGGNGEDGSGSGKNLYYAVQPVIMVEEGERLIRLKYMTESGYLDILGIMNQIQLHNKSQYKVANRLAILALFTSLTAIGVVVFSLA